MRVGLIAALLAVSLAAVAGLHMASAGGDKSPPSRRPNIVFFLCDDLGTGDLACLGSQDMKTPNIDALFARGTRLSRHWAGSSVCAPSRCVLLTGRHPGHAVIRSNREVKPEGQASMPADEPSLASYGRHFGDEEPYLGGRGYVPCRRPLTTYAAMITRMDREVGRIVSLLDELKLTDDTIFVFSSDNDGTMPGMGGLDTKRLRSNGRLRDWKGSPYEGGLRVPAVAVWPGRIPAGRVIDAPTGFENWLPTLLDLAGLADRIPRDVDGTSLASAFLGKAAASEERMLYRELTEGTWQAAVDGRWKGIRRAAGPQRLAERGPVELYDLTADPSETKNVADRHPVVLQPDAEEPATDDKPARPRVKEPAG